MGPGDKFCLQWNDFEKNISQAFKQLREDADFFDVTIACEDEEVEAHKLILSACSPFFKTLFRRYKHDHPLLYLKNVKHSDLSNLLDFMYHGEVQIAQEELTSFLATAQDLQVKGLTQQANNTQTTTVPKQDVLNNPEISNNSIKYKQEKLLESEEDIAAADEKENSFHENDKTSSSDQDEGMEGNLNLSGELDHLPSEEVDSVLSQHISRQAGLDRTDYVCLICQKYCKSRDECANHIEVHHLKIARSCPYCSIELTSRGGLRQHISRKHREEHRLAKGKINFN